MSSSRKKHCDTWYLLSWMRRRRERQFGKAAQSALDASTETTNAKKVLGADARGNGGAIDGAIHGNGAIRGNGEVASDTAGHAAEGRYRAGVTLAELKPGECGTIRMLIGSTQGRLRLLEMGLTPGTHIKVVRAAAFGGPLDTLVRGYQLSLRREEAASVWLDDEEAER